MSRTLTARQAGLVGRRALRAVPLVKITTYSDRQNETVDTVHRFSDRGLVFDGAEWLPNLLLIAPLRQAMSHVPDSTGADGAFDREASIVLRNSQLDGGVYLSEQLRSENILRSRVEISQLLLEAGERPLLDLSSLAASEALAWFRGEVRQVERMDDGGEFTLRLGSEVPAPQFDTLNDVATIPPRDRGKSVPFVYGRPKKVPLLGVGVGALSTVAVPLQSAATTVTLTDATDFPTSGTGRVNGEKVSWTSKSGNVLSGLSRALEAGTADQYHSAGSVFVYVPTEIKFALGQRGCNFTQLYVRNMLNDQITALPAGGTRDAVESIDIGGFAGMATVTFTSTWLHAALRAIVDATIAQQPEYDYTSSTGNVEVIKPLGNHFISSASSTDYMRAFGINGSSPYLERNFGSFSSGDDDAITFEYDSNQADLNGRIVNRYRLTLRGTLTNVDGNAGAPPTIETVVRVRSTATDWPGAGGTLSEETTLNMNGDAAGTVYNIELLDTWITPPALTELADFKGKRFEVEVENDGSRLVFEIDRELTGIEFELFGSAIEQTVEAKVAAAAGGVTLELYGDLEGPVVPAGITDYIGAIDSVIDKPADIVRHFLKVECGVEDAEIDTASFDACDTALEAGVAVDIVLSDYGRDLPTMLGALAFQTRTNIVQAEGSAGTVWQMHTPAWNGSSGEFEFPAPAVTLRDWQTVNERGRSAEGIANRFRVLYARDRSIDSGDESGFLHVYKANSVAIGSGLARITSGRIDDSIDAYGAREHGGFFLPDLDGDTTINICGSYLCHMALASPSVYEMRGVPWVDGYARERGDIVEFDLFYKAAPIKARILEVTKAWDTQLVDLVLVEVN